MHSGSPNPGLRHGQPSQFPRTDRASPAPNCSDMLVEADENLTVALRQAAGLDGARDRVSGVAFVERDDATLVVIDDQDALDEFRHRLTSLQRDYLVSDGLAEYADAIAQLRARLPRAWQDGVHAVAA